VAKDAADLRDVEPEVDDQVAGEGVAQIVKAHRLEAGRRGGALERAALDVAMAERHAVAGGEDVIAEVREARGLPLNALRYPSVGFASASSTIAASTSSVGGFCRAAGERRGLGAL